ncbi:MAG: M3 family oligoendopeptidase [Clostridia bacterium]|nr:M3 family oligoendopeptidase [Clostridia bacterium]
MKDNMTWDLSKLYASFDAPEFMNDMEQLKTLADEAVEQARRMALTVSDLEAAIRLSERMVTLAIKTSSFAQLTLAADANCEPAMAAYARLMPVMNRMEEATSALSAKLGGCENLEELIARSELLTAHAFLLRKLKRNAAHVIDPALEPTVLKMQMTGGSAWEQLRDQLDANHMVDVTIDMETRTLPLSAVRGMANSPEADVRKAAYEAELEAYPKMEIPMAACLNGIKGEARTLCELKRFDSVLDMALDTANMDRATLDALLKAMEESLPMFRRYFKLKARMLGYEGGLKFYDLFAPVGRMHGDYTPEDARALLVKEFGAFSPRMASMIDRAFDERWIDMYPREGKSGGAFCSGMHPLGISYVLTNFEGSYGSVSTLAHELGHAYHNECMKDVPVLMADYPMPLAETASIFNETLLAQRMLERADAPMRVAMLEQQLSDAAQVIVDIYRRFLFESEVVARRADTTLSPRELCEIMLDAQKKTYGDGLDPDCMHPYMWACKSHYYSTGVHFYNFPYAFGQLFAVGVYALYQQRGADFLPDYEKLLRSAGSGDVREVAASVGIDVADVNFWRGSLKVFEDKLNELEKLAESEA